ncbi:MAG: Holliday junction branch migration protein RuvA [Salinivirgaceae bacterium]|nr:MAG: Holliday junction branch migration protein RuvA [Salinivirgaceae bacterium]
MFEYIRGQITRLSPAHCVIDVGGVGYMLNISLSTYSDLKLSEEKELLVHAIYREDNQQLFGFSSEDERTLFRQLISVSGVGANTARMMLSSMPPNQLISAIVNEEVAALKSIKGIGQRSAERIVVDLKDKVKIGEESGEIFAHQGNTTNEEALSALMMLGFPKKPVEKVVGQLLKNDPGLTVEDIIKQALKKL